MNTRRYMRVLTTLFAFLVIGSTRIWALSASDIIIDGGITNGTVAVKTGTDGVKANADGSYTVTLVATPNNNYYITSRFIKVQKLVDPSAAPHKAPGIADFLPVSGSIVVGDGTKSGEFTFVVPSGYAGAHVTAEFQSTAGLVYIDGSTTASDITLSNGHYILTKDVDASIFENLYSSDFTGTLDGEFEGVLHTIDMSSSYEDDKGGKHGLFSTIKGGEVKNVLLKKVNVTTGNATGNAGAICNEATGASRIYNCGILSGSVSGSKYVGGLVGLLDGNTTDGYSRVINCFSYASVGGGTDRAGIVGYNNQTSQSNDITTMVMNCMFYGTIESGGTNRSPVYGGTEIDNRADQKGLNTYNYYRYESNKNNINKYNCALAVEDKYLVRFEFYRQLLNSNRPLAAWYVTGSAANGKGEGNKMAKWVLDRSVAPYPILKPQETYPSVVNYDKEYTYNEAGEKVNRKSSNIKRSQGKDLGTLKVTISDPSGSGKPTGASLTKTYLELVRTDKDTLNYNFNYDKVQLPYYNEVGTGNYTYNKVVTGWKITKIMGGTTGDFKEEDAWGGYNFADRNCTKKDDYNESGRVFSQGAYFDVPYGVTAITIEPYWGTAAYVADSWLDITYKSDYGDNSGNNKAVFQQYTSNGVDCLINGNTQKVYTSISTAVGKLSGSDVHDNAVVLVGNLHLNDTPSSGETPFTLMSADLDFDNEPDNSLIYHHSGRKSVSQIRFDFLNIPGTAMAQKPKNSGNTFRGMSIFKPNGWFEVTNTCNIYFIQFEYDNSKFENAPTKILSPVIFQGGIVDQFVSTKVGDPDHHTSYIHVGGNAYFKNFGNGTHSDGSNFTPHIPISVTGGDYDNFYLSGTYKPNATVKADDAECYISGGRFGELAGAAQQQIKGNVKWQIYDADIKNFYGGGVNADKPITGDITVNIFNSYVATYCGGPKFGNMAGVDTENDTSDDKTVRTTAEGCTFGRYFGAGYGGTSYLRQRYYDDASPNIGAQQSFYTGCRGKYYDGNTTTNKDGKEGPGVAADFDYEIFPWSDGRIGSRFYVKFASFSLAKTNDVHSNLKNCIVTGSYYGGGHLGEVTGTAYSELEDCKVYGNVFGGGYSAEVPKVPVRRGGFATAPTFLQNAGIITQATLTGTDEYEWQKHAFPSNAGDAISPSTWSSSGHNYIYTDIELTTLGQVKNTNLKIQGNTYVRGMVDGDVPEPDAGYADIDDSSLLLYGVHTGGTLDGGVYGGGDASAVEQNTVVEINNAKTSENDAQKSINNVYGGGNTADVLGNTSVTLNGGSVKDVYGGGRGQTTVVGGTVTVNIGTKTGTTLSGTGTVTGDVYGGSALGNVNATKGSGWTSADLKITGNNNATNVNLYKGTINGSLYGGGLGQQEVKSGQTITQSGIAANVYGPVTVTVEDGTAANVFGCNNLNGAPQQDVIVNIAGGTITNDVYGGGNQADAPGNITVNIQGGVVINDVYGGGALANTNTANWQNNQLVYAYEEVTGLTVGTSSVDGYFTLENTTYTPATGKAASGKTYYRRKYSTTVNLTGGTVGNAYGGGLGDLGNNFDSADDDTPAYVYGDVMVIVNGTKFNIDTDEYQETVSGQNQTVKVAKSGRVFGCNNLSGSPKGEVTVHVLKTVKGNVERTVAASVADKDATHTYEIAAVYGGGNMAAYEPAKLASETANTADADIASTNVIIETCGETSIQQVYGGGNAASTPSTKVTIKGSYEIDEVFGGGNGKDKLYNGTSWVDNPGAHVGFKKYTSDADKSSKQYGQGKARVNIEGGIIHSVFGGSNKKGNVRNVAIAMLDKVSDDCFKVDEAYGGGKAAPMDGRAILDLGCIPGVGEVYGGAQEADVNNDVELRIINGTYDKVYGGNNKGGQVKGTITVTIEEVGCEQIKIGELYGGGNEAAYSVEDIPEAKRVTTVTADNYYKNYPKVNVISATSIGKVFGGGDNAAVTGNPHVKIDMEQGVLFKNDNTKQNQTQALGTIAQVFGGGNNANVNGSTYVDIKKGQIKKVITTQADPTNNVAEVAIMPGVYGGCNTNGTVSGDTHVTLTGATIGATGATAEICGGGLGQPTVVSGTAYFDIGTGTPGTTTSYTGTSAIVGDLYGGSAFGTVANAEVNIFAFNSFAGDVYGGGKGKFIAANNTGNISAQVTGKSTVNMYATTITGHIYGGCNEHGTSNATEVNMLGGTLGVSGTPKADLLFAGGHGKETTTKNATMNIGSVDETTTPHTYSGAATIYSNVYGGSALGAVGVTSTNVVNGSATVNSTNVVNGSATVNLYQATSVTGDVFGDGMGYVDATDNTNNVQAKMGNSTVNLYALDLSTNIYGGCNYNGTVYGKATVNLIGGRVVDVYGGGQGQLTAVANSGSVEVNVGTDTSTGTTTVTGDIYGGSAFGGVHSPVVNIYSATSIGTANAGGNVFGGGKGRLASGNITAISASVTGTTTVNMKGGTVPKAIFGGCNLNGTSVDTEINVTGGTVGSTTKANNVLYGVFGGGYGQNTSVTGDVTVNIGKTTTTGTGQNATTTTSGDATVNGDVYGGSAQGSVNKDEDATTKTTSTTVHLYAGTVNGDVYGGGLGVKTGTTNIPAQVYGDVLVDLNNYSGTCAVTGGIFGCNNANGSPEGHVTVHVYKTQKATGSNASYDLAAVYGGGNKADYEPNDGKKSTEVVIEGCDKTSIQNVYGGGNAAATPATEVWILGTKAIENVFGGGNGTVSAANVGFKTGGAAYSTGTGKAETKLVAGNVTNVFGGSNSNGDVRGGTWVTMPQKTEYPDYSSTTTSCCNNLVAAHIYGGGQNAKLSGGTNIVLGCQPDSWIEEIYAGSMEADVDGDVSLTITSGKFKRVFGGNKNSGLLKGSITVNIEETGGCDTPIIIGELYGGGNQADYSVYGYKTNGTPMTEAELRDEIKTNNSGKTDAELEALFQDAKKDDPQLNVRAFTSIGAIYGGGYSAKMYGNPHVDINVVKGSHYNDNALVAGSTPALAGITPATTLPYPAHAKGAIGAIGNVFGGGNLATVYGNATVNIGTESTVTFITEPTHLGTKGTGEQTLETTGVAYIQRTDGLYEAKVEGANITNNVYGGGNQANVTGDTQVNICAKKSGTTYTSVTSGTAGVTIAGDVFGAGKGVDTDPTAALVESNSFIVMGNGSVKKSVYGGGELSQVAGNTNITVMNGTIGTPKEGTTVYGGATYGNVYGGGFGATTNKLFGLIKGNTNVTISNGTILHNVYGGGAYGTVGEFTYDATTGIPTGRKDNTTGGITYITITGGTIGTTGQENGMVFGSSRGDVDKPSTTDNIDPNDRLAWVYDTHVTIGTQNATTGPQIYGSLYGSGENGHTWHDTEVILHSGTIGVTAASNETNITEGSKTYVGAEYPNRGNVYGGGCGTDMYDTDNDNEGDTYNPLAGIVKGNTTITIDGGTVAHNVYGAGAMGSVGTITKDNNDVVTISSGGTTTITISGGTIGVDGTAGEGNVYGAARGDKAVTDKDLTLVKETSVTISGTTATTQIKGNVYGGGEVGNVHTNTRVNIQGGAIAKNVFGGGKGVEDLFTCEQAMVGVDGDGADATLTSDANKDKGTIVTISNGTVGTLNSGNLVEGTGNVYGGGEIGRVEWNTQVKIGVGTGNGSFAPIIYGNVFGAGKGLETHGYSALVRGNSTVTVQGSAKVLKNVYGGGEKSTVGRYWVKGINNIDSNGDPVAGAPTAPTDLPDGMPYQQQSGGICSVTVQGSAQIGPDAGATDDAGHVFGAGKGVNPHFVASGEGVSQKMTQTGLVPFTATTEKTAEELYLEFLETLALVTNSNVTIDGSATIKGSVYGGSESGFVQHNTSVLIQNGSTIGASNSYGNVYGGGKGYNGFAEAGRVSGTTTLNINGGTAYGSVYGGGELGFVKGAVNVNVTGGTVTKDVYGGGALADTNTENWNGTALVSPYHEEIGLTTGTSVVTGLYTKNGDSYTEITAANTKATSGTTYYRLTETKVNLLGGLIKGDAYGGGLGRLAATNVTAIEAKVYGDVAVNLGKAKADGTADLTAAATAFDVTYYTDEGHTDVVKSGRIFGCNNLNGSPKGNVTVTVNRTVAGNTQRTAEDPNNTGYAVTDNSVSHTYELADVYGGGNLADYTPIDGKVKVIINSCDVSVMEVYGGGNAAAVPATDVEVRGAYEIAMVFGGGNGKDEYFLNNQWNPNPGANVGGNATTLLTGGYIHEAYGGSNSKGTITGNINISKGSGGCCTLNVVELYGAGKDADVEGDLIMVMGCSETRTEAVYGCAKNANVKGNMELTITSGEYGKVFGGNNESGAIFGHIVINVEETGCTPIIIDELYGCGNDAAYSTYGYYQDGNIEGTDKPNYVARKSMNDGTAVTFEGKDHTIPPYDDPEINIYSCTRIGKVFGGGYGAGATVYGNPKVNINMMPGQYAVDDKLGVIGNVFGGGNEASVEGNATVNIGNKIGDNVDIAILDNNGNPVKDNSGKYTYTEKTVTGARIVGNVFGGGNLAKINGSTLVKIGTEGKDNELVSVNCLANTTEKPDNEVNTGMVFGGGNAADVTGNTVVNIAGGYVENRIYGGGNLGSVGTFTKNTAGKPDSWTSGGKCTVTVSGGKLGKDNMKMPDDFGYVFGASRGEVRDTTMAEYADLRFKTYVKETEVIIKGDAFILGGVYGGSENGHVRGDTWVKIQENCQIGAGFNTTTNLSLARYDNDSFINPATTPVTADNALATCAAFPYDVATTGKPYDPYHGTAGYDSKGGATAAEANDGHTFYGNVFGGGSGFFPYAAGKWLRSAGLVEGNTRVDIEGGHILSNVYGGNEQTDVYGTCTINMSGGTIGVPRTKEQIQGHPVIGNLFGAGKGDKRVLFNTWTNVGNTSVNVTGGIVYGSVFGGGEDGHVLGNATTLIEQANEKTITIGSTGESTADGNVFGGGRGSETALTAGVVGGNVNLTINSGNILGSVYGGGRLAAVGTFFANPDAANYGKLQTPEADHGNITININGGFIGTSNSTGVSGNVFGGSKGTAEKFDLGIVRSTTINMTGGTAYASVYGGGELAQVVGSHGNQKLGTEINISGGSIGINVLGKGGATWGNVYGGGKGSLDDEEAGLVKTNTKINVSQAEGKTTSIYHNIYGGGAYGSVGTFTFTTGVPTDWTEGTGKAEVIINGGTIGINGKENGMVFGSSRGDVAKPVAPSEGADPVDPNDKLAWVHDTHVVVGSNGSPNIKGTIYGSGENGHVFTNTLIDIHNGTIGVAEGESIGEYSGAAYPYRGNVYGGGCGTDMFDSDNDGKDDAYNPLAGIVLGNATINIAGGHVVRNVYGAGAMGSVGTVNANGTISGGVTTISISGDAIIGASGTVGDGNVFGAARGDANATSNEFALVRKATSVSVTGGTVKGNVYGGGELGCVGTYVFTNDMKDFMWTNDATPDPSSYTYNNTGACNVTISGGTIGTGVAQSADGTYANGNVFGAGKGLEDTWWCEKAIAYKTNVTITDGTINGTVYGGGQVGRVENNSVVTIGTANETGTGSKPNITGNVFGAGAGLKTHGYSALLRGDATVTVQGIAQVGGSVYGGGEVASVGRFTVIDGLPKHPDSGGTCTVMVQDHAKIGANGTGHNVFGACKGVTPAYNNTPDDPNRSKSMQLATNAPKDASLWSYYEPDHTYIWRYYATEADYLDFLETLALTSHPIVTIDEDATVNGSVFGGGERGVTLGSVEVNMNGGTVTEDVYGGGSLANTNKGNWDNGTWADGKVVNGKTEYTTAVNLHGGTINGSVFGGGLGDANTAALVYGDVTVKLNETTASDDCVVKGNVFGCNNVNGTPKGHAKVHVFKTVNSTPANNTKDSETPVANRTTYDVDAVFGGGKSADYVPEDATQSTEVIIEGCDMTSIKEVYGGGYGASTPGTNVLIKGTYIIDNVFGGGYGAGDNNPGANVGYRTEGKTAYGLGDDKYKTAVVQLMAGKVKNVYGGSNTKGDIRGGSSVTTVDKTNDAGCCPELSVQEIYGGGKEAPMEGGAEIVLGCMPDDWIGEIYAGAREANVGNDVSLTITSGKFGRVFGGNRSSGKIDGYVEVNIEECPTCNIPVVIGELYGGGNEAPYTLPDSYGKDYPSPRVNVRSFTSIGTIYGGGFGASAAVNGNPTVNINVGMVSGGGKDFEGIEEKTLDKTTKVKLYPHEKNKMGVIGNVFGGGNAAPVNGNTYVNVGTKQYELLTNITVGTTDVSDYYTRSGEGTAASPYVYTKASSAAGTADANNKAVADILYYLPVLGADIRGNVYGGGNNAAVSGKTNVVIGKKSE